MGLGFRFSMSGAPGLLMFQQISFLWVWLAITSQGCVMRECKRSGGPPQSTNRGIVGI